MPELEKLSPAGFKIALEIFVKGFFNKPLEIPIQFVNRIHGESKLTVSEQFRYLRHLRRLYHYKYPFASEFIQFSLVGSTGVVVDLAVFLLLQYLFGINHYLARCISFATAASSNWYLNRMITFSQRLKTSKLIQWPKFLVFASVSFSINFGVYVFLTTYVAFFTENHVLALLAGVVLGLGTNFMLSHLFVFKPYVDAEEHIVQRDLDEIEKILSEKL